MRRISRIALAAFGRHKCPCAEAPPARNAANPARVSHERRGQLPRCENRVSSGGEPTGGGERLMEPNNGTKQVDTPSIELLLLLLCMHYL